MIYIGIDPGPVKSGIAWYCVVEGVIGALKYNNEKCLEALVESRDRAPDMPFCVCIEKFRGHGMAVAQETFDACMWSGRFYQKAVECGFDVYTYTRHDIFHTVCGSVARGTKKSDAYLRKTLVERFGGDKKGEPLHLLKGSTDQRSAFAAIVCHMDKQRGK